MPFPYNFPFDFDVKEMLRMMVKTIRSLFIESEISSLRNVQGEPDSDLTIESEITRALVIRRRAKRGLQITNEIEGGG